MKEQQITVTSPLLPSLEELNVYLQDIWQRKWITNNGYYHQMLEAALCEYLGVPYISLFTNGTLPLTAGLTGNAYYRRGNNHAFQFCCYYTFVVVEWHQTGICRHRPCNL